MSYDVFISYSSQDKDCADRILAVLERNGIRCWIAPRDILPSKSWGSAIIEAIAGARVMVLVFSRSANASPQVEREVEAAIRKGIRVLPLRIEDIKPNESLEFFISVQHWLDAFPPPLEAHLGRLTGVLQQILNPPQPDPQPPGPPPYNPPPLPPRAQPPGPLPPAGPRPGPGGGPWPQPPYRPGAGQPAMRLPQTPLATFVHPRTGERRTVKAGFSWGLFFGSSLLVYPLFGVVFFLRTWNRWGTVYLLGSLIFYPLCFAGSETEAVVGMLGIAALAASVFLGFKGNEMTAKHLLRQGWTMLDDGFGMARAARQKWGLPG